MILVSPTEPKTLKTLGTVSPVPERCGADFVLPTASGLLIGVQRKTISDFIASVLDGRLYESMLRISDLAERLLLLEGRVRWTDDGEMLDIQQRHISREGWWGLLLSIQQRGTWVVSTSSLDETASFLRYLEQWAAKQTHRSLDTRPGPISPWGRATSRSWAIHLLQGFAGIGPELAAAIYDHFGRVPLAWEVTAKDLCAVPGIGKTRAHSLMAALGTPER